MRVEVPEWISTARETVDAAVESRQALEKSESALAANELLSSELPMLAEVSTAVGIGLRRGWLADRPLQQSGAVVRTALEAVVSKGALRRDVNLLQQSLPKYVAELRTEVERNWKEYVEATVGRIEDIDALIRLMAALPGQESQRKLLEKLRKPLLDLAKSIPAESSESDLASVAVELEQAFSQAFGNEDVRQFLLACSRTGATLDQMNASVSEWLQHTGADQLLRIRLGQSSA
ncbi:MAG: hypothetical protein K1X67_13030 [Fimbriimonadaceae bacterium]|mgnify:CR=1 FL=1|nr:hypothetical protein [Fimbriimonadaceae bacterium]